MACQKRLHQIALHTLGGHLQALGDFAVAQAFEMAQHKRLSHPWLHARQGPVDLFQSLYGGVDLLG
ncbi:hypothetical protein D3C79_1116630 [compost metagenome]